MSEEEQQGETFLPDGGSTSHEDREEPLDEEQQQVGRSSPDEEQADVHTDQSNNEENVETSADEQQADPPTEQSNNEENVEQSTATDEQQADVLTDQFTNNEENVEQSTDKQQADVHTDQSNNEENVETSADEQQADPPTEQSNNEENVEQSTATDEQQADAPTEQSNSEENVDQSTATDEQQADQTDQSNDDEENVENARGRTADDKESFVGLGILPRSAATVEMTSSDADKHPLGGADPVTEREATPEVINVSLQTDDGVIQDAPVEMERPHWEKAFLGGYRHKLTGAEYHHAAAQTRPRRRPDRGVVVFSRETQTADLVSETQQSAPSVSTQMTGVGCYISNLTDKLLSPGSYLTAEEYHATRLNAVIRLQAHTRRWLSCRAVDRLRRQRDRRLTWMDLQERRRQEEREELMQDSRNRWMQPKKREDLNLLYHALEKWRSDKEQQINTTLRGSERKAALCSLLEQETQYIATIGRHGIAIRSNNYNKAVRKFLDKSSTPHQWRAADGRLIEMDTPDTIRARELGDLYDCVAMSPISQEQRLDILLCLKQTVEEHPCQLTRDIVDLIHREQDLMRRHVKPANMEGLRKRLSTLFLQFIRTPGFNPEVAKHLKVPQSPSLLKNDVFLCHGCQRYLGSSHFRSCTRAHLSRRCLDCTRLRNIAGSRDDFSCYRSMLKKLRDSELLLSKDNTIPFLLQAEDLQYLVEVIWGTHSALSACNDPFSLALVRWERHKDWSPWNCILLSKEETSAHLQVEDVHKVYDAAVIHSIEHKHLLARRHYNQIPSMVTQASKAAVGKHGTLHASARMK
ncbi:IQ and ubiquitin-like domain-containing protein isoform X2 [Dunckerocampus dactyliophorus]|uniref:IQ and ubiquitin-like domain-containing protein isoform X2 n=1 Tax=Dunckerocampus dactyliophorus TaxID=161453 RepID=UPI002406EC5A|nr:IQ and ubiquitin-like domain-containing protein isoform X2 [Dunckerocampus dactyliophorus]